MTQTNSIWFTWWWHPSWIQPFCTKLWLKLVQSDSNSFILTQLDDGSHLELCHHGFNHFAQKKLHSFILTQLDDGSHLDPSSMLDSYTAILDSDILLSFLRVNQKHSHFILTLTQTNSIWLKLIQFSLNLMMAAILNSAILDSAILHKNKLHSLNSDSSWWWQPSWIQPSWQNLHFLDSAIWTSLITPSLNSAKIGSHHLHKKNFTDSFWLNLMMAAILNSAILDSDTLLFKKTLFTCSFSLNFMMAASILNSAHHTWIQFPFCTKKNFTHSFWLNLMMAAIWILPCWIQTLPSWIQTPCYLLSDSLKNTLTPLWLWLKLIQSDSNSFILT